MFWDLKYERSVFAEFLSREMSAKEKFFESVRNLAFKVIARVSPASLSVQPQVYMVGLSSWVKWAKPG